MSDSWLVLIPTDPAYLPSSEQAAAAKTLLRSFVPDADEISANTSETVKFIHPGGNWDGVRCPRCGADIESWWKSAMDLASKGGFSELFVTTICCGTRTSLNDLDYVWPAGFARFAFEATNPNVSGLSGTQLQQLSDIVGCPLRIIWLRI